MRGFSYLALDTLQPRTFIFASNADALVIQSTTPQTNIAFVNSYSSNNLDPIYYVSSSNDSLQITRNHSNIATFIYQDDIQKGSVSVKGQVEATRAVLTEEDGRQVVFKDYGVYSQFAGIGYTGGTLQHQIPNTSSSYAWMVASGAFNLPLLYLGYDTITQEPRLGIGTTNPTEMLGVSGNIFVKGTTYTSNLHVLGDTVILNTITSNTEEMVITNSGAGPALSVHQYGTGPTIEAYTNSNISFIIYQNGNVGIGTTYPRRTLDVVGDQIISGNVGIGTLNPSQRLYVYGNIEFSGDLYKNGHVFRDIYTEWMIDYATSNLYYINGNIGIGTTLPYKPLSVVGDIQTTGQFISATSNQPPLSVQSTQRVDNLNVQYLDGKDSSYYLNPQNISGGIIMPYQGGTGSNLLSENKLLVGQGASNPVLTPSQLHWDNSTQRLGIRQTNPQEALHIDGNVLLQSQTAPVSYLLQSAGNTGALDISASSLRLWGGSNSPLLLATNNQERVYITEHGLVGIGTTIPLSNFHLQGDQLTTGNLGIGTTQTLVALEVHSSNAILLPKGTTSSRPTGVLGYIRYNTETSQFEGFGAGNNWGSLGGVKSVVGDTYITAEYSPANDDKALHFYTSNIEWMTLNRDGNLGIGSTMPQVKLVVSSTDAVQLPKGTIAERPAGATGYIRYNTETSQFEGFGAGNNWGSLGGVKSVAGDTYITAEYSPANDDKALHFYTSNIEWMTLNRDGNLGIGTTTPRQRLDVYGGNAIISQNVGIGTTLPRVPLDVSGSALVSQYIGIGTTIPRTLSSVSTDITGNAYLSGNLGIGTTIPRYPLDVIGDQRLTGTLGIGTTFAREPLDVLGNSIISGNIGIGTTTTTQGTLYVGTDTPIILMGGDTNGNQISLQHETSYLRIGNTSTHIDVYGSNNGTIQMKYQTNLVFSNAMGESARIDTMGNLGIGTTTPRQPLDLVGTATISQSLGIGTTSPLQLLHVYGNTFLQGNVGIGTTSSRQELDILGSAIVSGNLGIGTTIPLKPLHVVGDQIYIGNLGIGTTSPRHALDVIGNSITSGNLGIGTVLPLTSLHVEGSGYYSLQLGIGTTTPRLPLDVIGSTTITGNLGIGTTLPQQSLDVLGKSYLHDMVGIGTSSPRLALDVVGSSTISGNLGIGTTLPLHPLHVEGTSYFQGKTGFGTSVPREQIDVVGNAILSGNVGIGTTAIVPSTNLHVEGTQYVSQSIGIGTTIPRPMAGLDIEGKNILLSLGNLGIGTATPRQPIDVIGTAIVSQGVGIGTTSPLQPLHVYGNTYLQGYVGVGTGTNPPRSELDVREGTALLGNVGIGTSAPRQRLDVYGTATITRLGLGGTIQPSEDLDNLGNTLLHGTVGIQTSGASFPLHIYSPESVLTSEKGRLAISKGIGISPSTDLEIVNSSNESYTGILVRNNGNVYPTASIRVQSHRWDADPHVAYASAIGLSRYNNNSYQRQDVSLGAIHFGGNHTGGSITNLHYASSIRGVAEADFTSQTSMPVSLVFITGSNGYAYTDTSATNHGTEQMRITSTGRVGIRTSQPRTELDVSGSSYFSHDCYVGGTLTASNLVIFGSNVIIDAITSNSHQLVIYNQGTGPALKVYQTGQEPIAEFYDGDYPDSQVAIKFANNGYVGINTSVPRERLDVVGNAIFTGGNIGIGTTISYGGVNIYANTNTGLGLSGTYDSFAGGPYWKQKGWDTVGSSHTISFPEYCVADNSSGTLQIQVKSVAGNKLGNVSLSFLKKYGESVDIFSVYYHKTDNLTTLNVSPSTADIVITTDNDCAIAWSSIGSC